MRYRITGYVTAIIEVDEIVESDSEECANNLLNCMNNCEYKIQDCQLYCEEVMDPLNE